MPVLLSPPEAAALLPVPGVRLGVAEAGIRKVNRKDLTLIELAPGEIDALHAASKMDWSAIEPAILGTLFERGLDPKIRAPLGANYTDPGTIMKLVGPVVVEPLEREWEIAKAKIGPLVAKYQAGGRGSQTAGQEAQALFLGHLERLKNFRVLDPACGSGTALLIT